MVAEHEGNYCVDTSKNQRFFRFFHNNSFRMKKYKNYKNYKIRQGVRGVQQNGSEFFR